MKNSVQKGYQLDYIPATDVNGGDFVTVGSLVGVVVADTATGELGAISTHGVFSLPKAAGTLSMGTKVMVPTAATSRNVNVVTDTGAGIEVGVVVETSAGTTVKVKLVG